MRTVFLSIILSLLATGCISLQYRIMKLPHKLTRQTRKGVSEWYQDSIPKERYSYKSLDTKRIIDDSYYQKKVLTSYFPSGTIKESVKKTYITSVWVKIKSSSPSYITARIEKTQYYPNGNKKHKELVKIFLMDTTKYVHYSYDSTGSLTNRKRFE